MKTLAKILFCLVVLTTGRLFAQETFTPLVSENCAAFVHIDFSGVEIDKVKGTVQKAGEDILRSLGFDDGSFKSTARELSNELEKLDIVIRPTFDTITKDLGIREIAVIADMELIEQEIPFIVAIPWKDKTSKQLDTLRELLNMESEPVDFVKVGNFLVLPIADRWASPEEVVSEWADEMEPAPKSPIFDALKSVADAEIKLAAVLPEQLRAMARSGGMPPDMPSEVKGLLLFATQKIQWVSASISFHEILGEKPPKNADVLLTLKVTKNSDAVQLRGMLEQLIDFGVTTMRFEMERDHNMAFQPPPLFFQFIRGYLRTLLPDAEDDTLKFRLKGQGGQTVAAVAGVGTALLLPAVQAAREAARRMQCVNHLKMITLAIHNYHDVNSALPPLYSVDKNGKPLHSWRVLLLPYMEQQALYELIRHDEPWDSEYNSQFHDWVVPYYSCPTNPLCGPGEGCTYVAVAGEAFVPAVKGREGVHTFARLEDGTSNTLAVIEVREPFCWMDPTADIELEDLAQGINADGRCGSFHPGGCNIALFDGSVRFIPNTIDTEVLQSLGDCNDGKPSWHDLW